MSSFRIYLVHPWLLLLLIPLAILTLWPVMRLPKARRLTINRKISLCLHSVILVLLLALLADMTVYREREDISTILLVDMSASTEGSYESINSFVEELSSTAGGKQRVGVVTFAKNALYVSELSGSGEKVQAAFSDSMELPEASATNLEEALYFSGSLLDDKENQRIVILSDGIQTDGDALAAARILAERGMRIDAVCIPAKAVGYEMQVNSVSHPEIMEVGETAELKAVVESNYSGAAEIRFYDNGRVINKRVVSIETGLTEWTAEYTPSAYGVHEISARIVPVNEENKNNNVAYSWLEVKGKGNLLIVDGTGRESKELKKLLSNEYGITQIEPEEAEAHINQLMMFDGIILMNVSNADFPEGFDAALETYVKKYGGGVLTSGGGNTYAYGSMTDTAFEEFLPVTLEEPEEQTTAMMIVVDTSSSMKGLRHEMAIQGTIQCIETLADTDYVGVLTFDKEVNVIYELSSMEQREDIVAAVEEIELGRGTYMTDATQEAFDQLKEFEADNKHVIILSDGEPNDSGYIRVVKQMANNGITVSAIAVGQGADRRIMENIAKTGGGNYYNAATVKDLPEIMVEETMAATDSYRQTGNFPIAVASYSTLLGGVDAEELPNILGYVTTFHKKGAEQYLTVNDGEPLYVQWNYGSGKVGSFTADLRGTDSDALFDSEAGQQLIRNMVSGVLRTDGGVTALQITVTEKNSTAQVMVSATIDGRETLNVSVLLPDGSEQTVEMTIGEDGCYHGEIAFSKAGVYTVIAAHMDAGGNLLDVAKKYVAFSYSREYNLFEKASGEELLLKICDVTGGSMAYTASHVTAFEGKPIRLATDPTMPMLIAILVLFLADIAVRKFRIKRK